MSILASYDGFNFPIRESDGYWNLTAMCQKHGKRLDHFMKTRETKEFIEALGYSLQLGVLNENTFLDPVSPVYFSERGRNGATWGHPDLALYLAQWLNPRFAVWVTQTIRQLLTAGSVSLEDKKVSEGLRDALNWFEEDRRDVRDSYLPGDADAYDRNTLKDYYDR